jgi:hypothetical protein
MNPLWRVVWPCSLLRRSCGPTTQGASGGGLCSGSPKQGRKKIGTLALAALIFFSVSGGPFGMEEVGLG